MGLLTLLLLALVPLAGGDLRRLAEVSMRRAWLLPLALGLQVLVITIAPGLPRPMTVGAHLVSYALAAVFLASNIRVPGLLLVAAGAVSNVVTISLNGGTLPASEGALARAGLEVDTSAFTNSGVVPQPRLPWLGDVFSVPASVPFANVYSIGDVAILLGAAWLLFRTCVRPPASSAPATRPAAAAVEARTGGAARAGLGRRLPVRVSDGTGGPESTPSPLEQGPPDLAQARPPRSREDPPSFKTP